MSWPLVEPPHYDEPIKFVFVGSKIVGSDILETNPAQLMKSIHPKTLVRVGTDGAELEKILLNAKESISFRLLLEDDFEKLDVSGRVIDGAIVRYTDEQPPKLLIAFTEVIKAIYIWDALR